MSPIIMITSLATQDFKHEAIAHDRMALSSVFNVLDKGLNISVNQASMDTDEFNVVMGPGAHSLSPLLNAYPGIANVLKVSDNPEKALAKAVLNVRRNASKLQHKIRKKTYPVTRIMTAVIIAIFALSAFLTLKGYEPAIVALMLGAYYKPLIVQGFEIFRFLTAGLVHVDSFHLLMNVIAFNNLGMMVEPILSKWRYLIVLLAGIVFGNVFVYIVDQGVIGLGISGGLFAILGVLLVYLFETQAIKNPRIQSRVMSILFMNLLISMLPGVSMMAHVGGLQAGIFLGLIFSKRKDWNEIRRIAGFMFAVFSVFLVMLMIRNTYVETDLGLLAHYTKAWQGLGFDWYVNRLISIFF